MTIAPNAPWGWERCIEFDLDQAAVTRDHQRMVRSNQPYAGYLDAPVTVAVDTTWIQYASSRASRQRTLLVAHVYTNSHFMTYRRYSETVRAGLELFLIV